MAESLNQLTVRLLAVIVLYKVRPGESAAFRTLLTARAALPPRQNGVQVLLQVLLYDNTPGDCDHGPLPEGVRYEAARENAGLAPAYNRALAIAQREQCTWLLILDQDTTLPFDYLSRMSKLALEIELDNTIAAIVPRLLDAGRVVGPVFVRLWGVSYLPSSFAGTSRREIQAPNSAVLVRVDALKQIGGFSPYFWLDYLDGYLFHQLYLHGMKVYVAGDIEVEHELSLLHEGYLTPERFHNVLRAESAFWDLYGGKVQGLALTARLLCRIWRQKRRGHGPTIRQLTWNELKRRISRPRMRRVLDWMHEMEHLGIFSSAAGKEPDVFEERPGISVCMAAYNGERHIAAQLQSILSQLAATDEVIVVDDASTDGTRECVRLLNDSRIQLIEHSKNQGVSHTFEEAISAASGKILFLSDQDDLWEANKVSLTLRAFQLCLEADVAVSDAALIDQNNALLGSSYYAQRGSFRSGVLSNVFRCSYLGCTMAFRSRLRATILPFPPGAEVFHDLWIGAVNSLTGGRTLYIDHSLVRYRRHGGNATGNRRLTLAHKLRIRWTLCRSLVRSWCEVHLSTDS